MIKSLICKAVVRNRTFAICLESVIYISVLWMPIFLLLLKLYSFRISVCFKWNFQAQQSIGYCPQFDALLTYLTGRETLEFYGRLRGLHGGLIRVEIERLLHELHLTHHADVAVKYYSGGQRRKLSVAVALLGDSPLLCLDEPTTGVDPISRRRVWSAIIRHNQRGRTVLLSSHRYRYGSPKFSF